MTDESLAGNGSATPLIDAATLRERQRASQMRIQQVQARAQEAKARLAGERSTVTSSDRTVTVTVDAAGTLLDLTFTASAAKVAPAVLARTVLATYRQATQEAVGRTAQLVRELIGENEPVLDAIRASVEPDGSR